MYVCACKHYNYITALYFVFDDGVKPFSAIPCGHYVAEARFVCITFVSLRASERSTERPNASIFFFSFTAQIQQKTKNNTN